MKAVSDLKMNLSRVRVMGTSERIAVIRQEPLVR
jgi:hypothetical protein